MLVIQYCYLYYVCMHHCTGAVAIETIERCGCVNPSCYRVDYYESYWDYVSYNNHTLRRENKVHNSHTYNNVYTADSTSL